MKAYQLHRHGNPHESFRIADLPSPKVRPGLIKIKVDAFGLNFADVMARLGVYRDCPPLPAVLGYDVEGIVSEIGEGVENVAVGDRVFGLTRFGGYAEEVVTEQRAVGKLPRHAKLGDGAALAVQYTTAYHAAEIVQTLIPGEIVLIHAAAGGVGTALVQLCKHRGCQIIGTAGNAQKIQYLKEIGVDCPINYRESDFEEEAKKFLGKRKLSAYFDNLGGKSIKIGKGLLMPGGRIVSYGAAAMAGKKSTIKLLRVALGFGFFSPISYLQSSQAFIGVNMLRVADHKPDLFKKIIADVSVLYREGVLVPKIGKVFKWDQLSEAHQFLESRKSIGKIVVKLDE